MIDQVGGEKPRAAPGGIQDPAAAALESGEAGAAAMKASTSPDAPAAIVSCGCGCVSAETPGAPEGESGPRHAVAVAPGTKERNLKRLRRIEGQVRGLQRMVEEERYCADIMTQIASAQEALRGVGRELMRNHLKHCAAQALRSEDPERAEAMYDELLELMYKHVR